MPFNQDTNAEIEQLQFALQAANVGTWDYNLLTNQAKWSSICKALFGLPSDTEVTSDILLAQVHPDDREWVGKANSQVLSPASDGSHDITFRTLNPENRLCWVQAKGRVIRNEQEHPIRFSGVIQEVTQAVLARQTDYLLQASEQRFQQLIRQAPVAIAHFKGPQFIVDLANERVLTFWGRTREQVMNKPLFEALPEARGQGYETLLVEVYTTGKPFASREMPVDLFRNGKLETAYIDFVYEPHYDSQGAIDGVMVVANEITQQVEARRKVEASQSRFRSLIEEAPIASCLFVGRDMVVEIANKTMLGYWGKGDSVLGKPIHVGVPELLGQPFLPILDRVYTTGEPYQAIDAEAQLVVDGVLGTYYFDFTYKAVRDENGVIYGVMDTAIDVTEKVLARRKIEQSEASLREAVELSQLGTWSIDLPVSTLDYSPRLRAWLGIDQQEEITVERAYQSIRVADRASVREAMLAAIAPNSSQLYDVEYGVNARSGQQPRILHAQGKVDFDEMGVAYRINGFVQDVTLQRNTQLLLEQQVQERTEELAAINEELTATSDELAQANQELEDSNVNLSRSNKNLEQFAYIASHDLQEPLRKIQQFGDLLKTRFDGSPGEDLVYLDRMQSAARRMSNLIRDLLAYSRISTGQIINTSVSLNQVVNQALDNLSVVVEETKAQIQRDDLPTVLGDKTQLGQLFLNLLSNAFKFSSQDKSGEAIAPQVTITHQQIQNADLPANVKPNRYAETYHLIEVSDNGIGFDKKYLDRIFQVFQRLHGKNEFAGTGVGLAIVEKVVANHGGAITAASKPGEGATFSVYLPA